MAETYRYCGNNADLTGGTRWNREFRTRNHGVATQNTVITGQSTETSYCFSIAGTPGLASWGSSQTWYMYVDITSSVNKTFLECQIHRINAAGSVQETKTSSEGEQSIATAGLFTFTFSSISWSSGSRTDRIRVDFIFKSTNHGDEIVTLDTADTYMTADLTATPMTQIFDCNGGELGFSGDFYDTDGAPIYRTTGQSSGDRCIEISTTGTSTERVTLARWTQAAPGGAQLSGYALTPQWRYKVVTAPSADNEILCRAYGGASDWLELRLNSDRKIDLYDNDTGLLESGTTPLTIGVWYRLDALFCAYDGTAQDVPYSLEIDGSPEYSGVSSSIGTSIKTVDFGKPVNRNSETIEFEYDDIVLADEYEISEAVVVSRVDPESDGTDTDWTANTGDKWDAIDEAPHDGNTTYIYSAAVDDAYTANLESASSAGISGTIHAVRSHAIAFQPGALIQVRTRWGGTVYDSDDASLSSAQAYSQTWSWNPEDDLPFATTDIDGAELGAQNRSITQARVTAAQLTVVHTEPSGTPVSNDFDGAHEAHGYIEKAADGAHEAHGWITDNFDGAHEANLSVSQDFDGAHEAFQSASKDFDGAHEAHGWIESPRAGGHEAHGYLEGTFDGAHEANQSISEAKAGGHEAVQSASAVKTGAHEAHGWIEGPSAGAHEANQSLEQTFDGAHEAFQSATKAFDGAHESHGWIESPYDGAHEAVSDETPISNDFDGAHEAHGWIEDPFAGGHEGMQPLEQTFDGAHEALQGVSDAKVGAHEAHGWIEGTADGVHEAHGWIEKDFDGTHEANQPAVATFDGGHEAMSPVSQDFDGAHEGLQGFLPVSAAFGGVHEALGLGEGLDMDAEQIIKWCFDPTQDALRTTNVGAASGQYGSDKDWRQIIKDVYTSGSNKLRVTTVT